MVSKRLEGERRKNEGACCAGGERLSARRKNEGACCAGGEEEE